jgi:DNA-binding CsgD family transcriptional regulator
MWEGAAARIVTAIDVTERVRAGERLQEQADMPNQARDALSARERETVRLLAEGASNKEVAAALGISVRTAETKRARLLRKLGLDSLAALVRYAIRNDIIQP